MRDYLYFAGKNLDEFETFITNAGVYSTPERNYESIEIAGRSGNLIIENDKFDNVEHRYPMIILKDFNENYAALKSFLLSKKGYQRLADTFYPDEFYLASFKRFENIKQQFLHGTMGSCVLVFERKPQRYLVRGEDVYTFTTTGNHYILSPTPFNALPILRVWGSGTLTINGKSIVINTEQEYLTIDCELQEVLEYGGNLDITLSSGEFPSLHEGNNLIRVGSGITKVQVTPRWWKL